MLINIRRRKSCNRYSLDYCTISNSFLNSIVNYKCSSFHICAYGERWFNQFDHGYYFT